MTKPSTDKLQALGRKGLELGMRTAAQAPEQRQARRLVADLDVQPADDPTKVLFLSPRNWSMHVAFEGLLATSLRLRGADVRFLNCGGGLDICDRSNTHATRPMPCRSCSRYSEKTIDAFGLEQSSLRSEWLPDDPGDWSELAGKSTDEMASMPYDGLDLGDLVGIPVRWFLLNARLEDDPLGEPTMRAFLTSARRVARGFRASIDRWRPDTVFMLNGLFFFEGIARAICEEEGIDVVTYERTYRSNAFVFARNQPANRFDMDGIWATRGAQPLTDDEDAELEQYLDSRRTRAHPLLDLWKDAVDDRPERPTTGKLVTLFSNVTWDSSVLKRDHAFTSMHDWLAASINYFIGHPEHKLIVRVHPSETRFPGKETREPVADFVHATFPSLPDNIIVLGPDDPTSSYPIMEESDLGLVFTSTVGIEMAVMGKPVLVAGETHYRERGFTYDASTTGQFEQLLDEVLAEENPSTPDLAAARRYAYAFFFDAPISMPFIDEPILGLARLTTESLDDLKPGANPELDRVCEAILQTTGTPVENTYFLPRT